MEKRKSGEYNIFVGVDLVTFRDIGLLGGALAMLIISFRVDTPPMGKES